MKTSKQLKLEQKINSQQKGVVGELHVIAQDIERCEKSIISLQEELGSVNARHANRQGTEQDIRYLEDLLVCAKKKLIWERQMASLQKRTPELMQRIEHLVNHPESNPDEQTRASLLESLNTVKAAMERLQTAKGS